MTTTDEIETILSRALAVSPTEAAMHALDRRVAQVMATSSSAHARHATTWRRLARPLAVAAAFVVLTGTVVGAMNLVERTVDPVPGWRTAWDRGVVLDLESTDSGITVTLERAYADLNQVVVVVTATGLEGLGSPRSSGGYMTDHFTVGNASLRDPSGRGPVMVGGTDVAEPGLAASVRTFQFDPPLTQAGTYTLRIADLGFGGDGPDCTSPCTSETVDGAWTFVFDLPAPDGTVVASQATDTVGTARLDLIELRVTPTMIVARIAMFVDGRPVGSWSFIPSDNDVRHGDEAFDLSTGRHILVEDPTAGPEMEFSSTSGTDAAAGIWTITIPAVDYSMGTDGEQHLAGPWTLTVDVP